MPQKQGVDALKAIHKKNPEYFDQFTQDADRRAVEVLGPLFGVNHATWKTFREEHLGSDAERVLSRLHQQLAQLLDETKQFIRRPEDLASFGRRKALSQGPRRRSKVRKPRLSAEEKEARNEAKKLRLVAHRLVLRVAKKRDVSPAMVYAELTKKYGHKAREADVKELESRIALLKAKR